MNRSVIESPHQSSLHPDIPPMDEEVLEDIVQEVRNAFVHPAASQGFDLKEIHDFLDLTREIAQQAGVFDGEQLGELLDHAARVYVARSVQDRVSGMLQLTLEWSSPPTQTQGQVAFFRKFATTR